MLNRGTMHLTPLYRDLLDLPKVRLSSLQSVLNAATRLIARLPHTSHIPLPSCLTIFIGYHSLLGFNSRFSHIARILVKLHACIYDGLIRLPSSAIFLRP